MQHLIELSIIAKSLDSNIIIKFCKRCNDYTERCRDPGRVYKRCKICHRKECNIYYKYNKKKIAIHLMKVYAKRYKYQLIKL